MTAARTKASVCPATIKRPSAAPATGDSHSPSVKASCSRTLGSGSAVINAAAATTSAVPRVSANRKAFSRTPACRSASARRTISGSSARKPSSTPSACTRASGLACATAISINAGTAARWSCQSRS